MDPKLINCVKMNFFFHKNAKIESESKSKKKFRKNYKIHICDLRVALKRPKFPASTL